MSTTRLLVIGVVRMLAPVHGYLIRQELVSWHVDAWAHVNPGSVYSALKTLTAGGFLQEVATESDARRPARTTAYQVTAHGEVEFLRLLREHLWTVDEYDLSRLMAALSFMWALPRAEVVDALTNRLAQLESRLSANTAAVEFAVKNPETPDHVQEMFLVQLAHLRGERSWTQDVLGRIAGGAYSFHGEDGAIGLASKAHAMGLVLS